MTAQSIRNAINAAAPFPVEPPRPLQRALPPPEPFPVGAMGDVLGQAAKAINDIVQAPLSMCAQSVIAAATLAAQAHADVELPSGAARPLSGFLVSIAETGERKTTVDSLSLDPVRAREAALRKDHAEAQLEYHNALAVWEKTRDRVLKDRKMDTTATRVALDALGPSPRAPLHPMLLATEPTVEGLVRCLINGQPSVGIFTTEGGQFIGGHALSEEHKLKTAAALSALWDGEPVRRVRAGDGVVYLPGRRVAAHLMVQPGVAGRLFADATLRDQGLLSRILVVAPEPASGTRLWREPHPASKSALARYAVCLGALLETPPATGEAPNELTPRVLRLATTARALWIGFADAIERQIGPDGPLAPVKALANKAAEHAARLAGVLTLVSNVQASAIGEDEMAAGIELVQAYIAEALRLTGAGATDPDLILAESLRQWLGTRREQVIGLPEVYRLGPLAIRDAKTARRIVAILVDHGWLVPLPDGATVDGVPRREAWWIVRE